MVKHPKILKREEPLAVDVKAINDWLKTFMAVGPREPIVPPVKRNSKTWEVRDGNGKLLMIAGPCSWKAIKDLCKRVQK